MWLSSTVIILFTSRLLEVCDILKFNIVICFLYFYHIKFDIAHVDLDILLIGRYVEKLQYFGL